MTSKTRHRRGRATPGDSGSSPLPVSSPRSQRCWPPPSPLHLPRPLRRLRGPRWWRDDPVVRVRRGDRLLLCRGRRHCRRSSSVERSPRRAIRADGSDADRHLVGPTPPLRGRHRHHHRPRRAIPRRCHGDDPHPGAEPPHPDRLTNLLRRHRRSATVLSVGRPGWPVRKESRSPGPIRMRCGQPRCPIVEAGAQISLSKLAGARGRIVRPHSTFADAVKLGIR